MSYTSTNNLLQSLINLAIEIPKIFYWIPKLLARYLLFLQKQGSKYIFYDASGIVEHILESTESYMEAKIQMFRNRALCI